MRDKSAKREEAEYMPMSEKTINDRVNMKVIGVTGGIGSGKSLVTNILREKYGAYIVNSDGIARQQMEPGGVSYIEVVEFFGNEILLENGAIDKNKLSHIVFNDRGKLYRLNLITHPKVLDEIRNIMEQKRLDGETAYFVIETALMIESGYSFVCDEVWYVYAPEASRRAWLMSNRDYTEERIDAIFSSQKKDEDFRKNYAKVIENDSNIDNLVEQVDRLIKELNK